MTAIGEATRQGGQLTTELLANCAEQPKPVLFDLIDRLARLAPMLRVLADTEINLARACRSAQLFIRAVPADFDAALLELVSNAAAAGASSVTVRTRLCGSDVWLLVSDNGAGMSASTLQRARRGHDLGLAHGSGLARVRQFMTAGGGRALIRSCPGGGTSFALIFPAGAVAAPTSAMRPAFPAFEKPKALIHAPVRHPVAA
ncbi:ATP-binding protein [Novosphingobium sp. G106]|uniref:ATP-binding protein n=1 Tax=Novosphingobium sp. G106 TaxID=2849500 RepID=UPI001C2DCABB|nr:ATP-binding protein [Novosphingobium sp. G106]MBV1691928.1 ATP-binding protein [Novosphingobium sp. G106]